jgi:hypothetical protein
MTAQNEALFAFFEANPEIHKTSREQRNFIVNSVISFMVGRGTPKTDGEKLWNALVGTTNPKGQLIPGPCALITTKAYVCDATGIIHGQGELFDAYQGQVDWITRSKEEDKAVLRPETEEDPQKVYILAVQKKGNPTVENGKITQNYFWTYNVVIPSTEGDLPMVLAYDVNKAEDEATGNARLSGCFSPKLYRIREENTRTGQVKITDRLANLVRPSNDELLLMGAMVAAGFPVETARVNRPPLGGGSNGRWNNNRQPAPSRSLAMAGGSRSATSDLDTDPYEDR